MQWFMGELKKLNVVDKKQLNMIDQSAFTCPEQKHRPLAVQSALSRILLSVLIHYGRSMGSHIVAHVLFLRGRQHSFTLQFCLL